MTALSSPLEAISKAYELIVDCAFFDLLSGDLSYAIGSSDASSIGPNLVEFIEQDDPVLDWELLLALGLISRR